MHILNYNPQVTRAICSVIPILFLSIASVQGIENSSISDYQIDISFQPTRHYLEASALLQPGTGVSSADSLQFFLHHELSVTSLRCGEQELNFKQDQVHYDLNFSLQATRIRFVAPPDIKSDGIAVDWSGQINSSRARTKSDYMRIDSDGVFLRSFGYSLWFPVFHDDTFEAIPTSFSRVTIRLPDGYQAVFCGHLLEEETSDGIRSSVWAAPEIDLFNAQCSARKYITLSSGALKLYYLPDAKSKAQSDRILGFADKLLTYFRAHYSDGAINQTLHILQLPEFGNIGSSNVIGISDDVWMNIDPGSYTGRTLAHELVHASVYVPTRVDQPMYALMREGFPSYFHFPALGALIGEQWYQTMIDDTHQIYLKRRATGKTRRGKALPREIPILELTADDIGTYKDCFIFPDRVWLFFNYLRTEMGTDRFLLFTRELMTLDHLTEERFVQLITSYLPEARPVVEMWLTTIEYPERLYP